ncbi:MAG: hypothetical protein HGB21_16795, partial [Nitrospirae bacterium]|nr:hypothetical protein [Nitrospirota bacterium]
RVNCRPVADHCPDRFDKITLILPVAVQIQTVRPIENQRGKLARGADNDRGAQHSGHLRCIPAKNLSKVQTDIPLADRCLKKGVRALGPKGKAFTEDSIGDAMAGRELSAYLREMGAISGGPAPFGEKDRSRFLHALDMMVREAVKAVETRSRAGEGEAP